MASIKHTHVYVFFCKIRGIDHYKCDDPHCTHYASVELIKNKASVCSKCRQTELILNYQNLRRRRPLCLNCADTEEGRTYRKSKEIMNELLKDITKAS